MDQSQDPTQMHSLIAAISKMMISDGSNSFSLGFRSAEISKMTISDGSNPSTGSPGFPPTTQSPKLLPICPNLTLITMLTAMLHMFYREGKSPRQINDFFVAQGKFFTLKLIQAVIDAKPDVPDITGVIENEADASDCIGARMSMMCFISWSGEMGRNEEDIDRELNARYGWRAEKWFVSDLLMYEKIHKGD